MFPIDFHSGVSQESSIMTISNFPVDGYFNSNGEYCPYGMNVGSP